MKYYLVIITFSTLTSYAQPSLENYFSKIRQGKNTPFPEVILNADAIGQKQMLNELQVYSSDSIPLIRSKAFDLTGRIGKKSKDQLIRQQAAHLLVSGIKDRDSGISGNNSNTLQHFSKTDFDENARQLLLSLLKPETFYLDRVAKLAGYLEIKGAIDVLRRLLDSEISFKTKWHIKLSLARMNDQQAADYIRNKLNTAEINDALVYSIVPDLIYTRHPQIFKYLETIMMSDEKSCQSANPDANQNILCGYRVLEYLAGTIEGFPVKVDEYGEAEIDDYEKTLMEVRKWFTANENYVIGTERY